MAEEVEGQDTGAEAKAGGVDPAAVALALAGASREEADAFLKDQRAFIADQRAFIEDQRHHLHEQLKNLRLNIWEKYLGVLLRIATAFIGLAVAAALAGVMWDAAHADGLVIESFSVPPDLTARGLTGQVVATQVLDKLTGMQNDSTSIRPSKSYANNWDNNIEVQIPDTGVSVGEAYRFMTRWLGHETHITGEVYRTASGLAVAARVGGAGATYAGPESDFDSLIQKAAEHIYASTQPYRYARYLTFTNRLDEAGAIFNHLIVSDPAERAWAWMGLANLANDSANPSAAIDDDKMAIAANPELTVAYGNLCTGIYNLAQIETALANCRKALQLLDRSSVPDVDPTQIIPDRLEYGALAASYVGDYASAISLYRRGLNAADPRRITGAGAGYLLRFIASQHDGAGTRAYLKQLQPPFIAPVILAALEADAALEKWPEIIRSEPSTEGAYRRTNPRRDAQAVFATQLWPWLALAKAELGDLAGAEAVITTTPGDCYNCARVRGTLAAVAKQWGRADYWFARAVGQGPSLPFAETDWGQALLARGKPDDAIEKFKLANQKGPHFADPLEGWGEALMAKNRSDLALAKFTEANKYAPNWGRLHLKWGEALGFAGHKDEAQKQFAQAATFDLSAVDKAELAKVSHG